MIVSRVNYLDIINELQKEPVLAVDTETTGLMPYKGDKLFSIIIASKDNSYYFNYNTSPDNEGNFIPEEFILEKPELLNGIFNIKKDTRIYLHNAKFDLHFLAKAGVNLPSTALIFCTQANARVIANDLDSYSLANLSKLSGSYKDDKLGEYIKENKLYDIVKLPGKKKSSKNLKFYLAPFELITKYGIQDGAATFRLGEYEINRLDQLAANSPKDLPTVKDVAAIEQNLTPVLFKMERTGIKIDSDYLQKSKIFLSEKLKGLLLKFSSEYDTPYVDSSKCFKPLFDRFELPYGVTDKGNASFKDEYLNVVTHPLARLIQDIRATEKDLGTYVLNFEYLKDYDDVIHCDFKQAGTVTGRMSCANPNLQNVPKDSNWIEDDFIARRCFVPRKGYFFSMIDFDQMEYRLMLDYAEEMEVIEAVLGGLDVHTATAEVMGVDRTAAKTINFMLLYGGGPGKLAEALKVSLKEAKGLKALYFEKLPNVEKFINNVIATAEVRGFIFNWTGRRYNISRKFAYKAPNYLIQGGAADIVKKAMIEVDKFLDTTNSRMVLQVHDEIVLEVSAEDKAIPYEVKKIMESAYPYKHLPLTCGIDYSAKSWADKEPYNG
jgi:DNA polymerase-1